MSEHPLYPADTAVSRERQALIDSTLREVASARSTDISLRRLATAAGQSLRFARQEFGNADSLIIATAILTARDALTAGERASFASPFAHFESLASVLMDHFGRNRPFYRAVLSGPLAARTNEQLDGLVGPMNQLMVDQVLGTNTDATTRAETTEFFTARSKQIVGKWLTDPDSTETAEDIKPRLRRIVEVLGTPKQP